MDIQAHIKYTEGYLPTPRHRKLRYRECDEIITATLREVEKNDLKLAFEDNSYEGKGKIYSCDGELWVKSETNQPHCIRTSLEELQEDFMKYSWFYGFDPEDTREKQIAKVVEKLSDYIVADGELYAKSGEPRYCIYTFGLGHNHGGTSLSVDYMYNSNISKDRYFSALDGEKALQTAIEIATNRGDTESIEHFSADIVVHDPKAVTIKPEIQHGDGDEFLGKLESVISGSSDIAESGLLAMLLTGAEMNKAEPEKHIIWSNINLDLDDWKDDLKEEYPDKSDDELYSIMCETNSEYLLYERVNLDIKLSMPIIIIADLGLWNGRVQGYKDIDSGNIKDCLYSDNDYTEWFVDEKGDFRATDIHHDGTNHYLYRVFKDNVTDEQMEDFKEKIWNHTLSQKDIDKYTRRLGDEIAKVYGFDIPKLEKSSIKKQLENNRSSLKQPKKEIKNKDLEV